MVGSLDAGAGGGGEGLEGFDSAAVASHLAELAVLK